MKSTYKFLLAAFAATVALASCTKDIAADRQDTVPQDGLRKIAISFGTPTKTVLGEDGITPTFTKGDEIMVSDESGDCQKVTVELYENGKGTEPYFRTTLKGDLYAVYPESAAIFDKDGKLSVEKFNILSDQTGLFEDANIAVGQITDENQMKFKNASAILKFYVGPEIGVNRLIINAKDTIDGTWKLTEAQSISVDLSSGSKFRETLGDKGRVCYVAVPSISSTAIMTVDSYTTAQTSSPNKPVTRVFRDNNVGVNQMVNVFIPYYIKVGDQKWGYCNIGAFLPEESGYYFSWGNPVGYYYDTTKWLDAESKSIECRFTGEYYKRTDGSKLNTDILATEEYDAARYAWGDGWRMPTAAECKTLVGIGAKWFSGNNGQSFYNSRGLYVDNKIFFPAAGYAEDNVLTAVTTEGYYWTSTNGQYSFKVGDATPNISLNSSNIRHLGYLIRPIYDSQGGSDDPDEPVGPDDPDDTDEGMKFTELTEHGENI